MADALLSEGPVQKYITRNRQLQERKAPWLPHFQRLGETFLTRKQDFTATRSPGEFLYENVFDNVGEFAAMQAASSFLSMLWPDSSRTFMIKPVRELQGLDGVDEHFRYVNEQMYRFMDKPQAGLLLALQEFEIDQQVFGTSGVGTFENDDESLPVIYDSWSVKGMCVSENAQGFVDRVYLSDSLSIRQLVEEYGLENVAPKVREIYASGRQLDDKVAIIKVIEPREVKVRKEKMGKLGMAVRTLHIDIDNKHIMREGGYEEMPVAVGRMIKTIGEEYGRSPAMTALPDANSANALKEAVIVATEKLLDPPLGVLDDGRLGGGTIDTSAGALNVFNSSGRLTGDKPVFPLYTVGELQSAEALMKSFKDSIFQAFSLDRLLDLNNQTQMTAYETSVRNRMRGEALGAMFARQIAEVFTPTIERTFNILYRKGLLGIRTTDETVWAKAVRAWKTILGKAPIVIPDSVQKAIDAGLDVYDVEYISPAKRFMQAEKLQGIYEVSEYFLKVGITPGAEDIMDNFDIDEAAKYVISCSGAPISLQRTISEVKAIREGRARANEEQAKLNSMKQITEAARNAGQAEMALKTGGI